MTFRTRDLPWDMKDQMLRQIRGQVGAEEFARLVRVHGEDGLVDLVLEGLSSSSSVREPPPPLFKVVWAAFVTSCEFALYLPFFWMDCFTSWEGFKALFTPWGWLLCILSIVLFGTVASEPLNWILVLLFIWLSLLLGLVVYRLCHRLKDY